MSAPRICDAPGCEQPANTVHTVPDVVEPLEIKLGCSRHSFGRNGEARDVDGDEAGIDAYWFAIDRWESGEMETHIRETKVNGARTAQMIHERLSS